MGITGDATLRYQAINSVIALLGELCCILFIDRFGRRRPLVFGNLGNMVTFIIACILLKEFPPKGATSFSTDSVTNVGASWAFIIMTWLYNFSFSATCGPLSWYASIHYLDWS